MTTTKAASILTAFLLLQGCSGGNCELDGKEYSSGDTFFDADLCNQCSCGNDGRIACTAMACAPLVPRNGSWCVSKWGGTWGTTCHVNELSTDGTRLGELAQCSADGGVADAGSGACWEMLEDSSCTDTNQRLSVTPPSEASGHLFRVVCY